MPELKGRHILAAAGVAGAVLLGYCAVRLAGGTGEEETTEDAAGVPTPLAPVLALEEHLVQPMFTAHRYPRACGQEVTTAIHRGYSMASIPLTPESYWMTRPPSELVL